MADTRKLKAMAEAKGIAINYYEYPGLDAVEFARIKKGQEGNYWPDTKYINCQAMGIV